MQVLTHENNLKASELLKRIEFLEGSVDNAFLVGNMESELAKFMEFNLHLSKDRLDTHTRWEYESNYGTHRIYAVGNTDRLAAFKSLLYSISKYNYNCGT